MRDLFILAPDGRMLMQALVSTTDEDLPLRITLDVESISQPEELRREAEGEVHRERRGLSPMVHRRGSHESR